MSVVETQELHANATWGNQDRKKVKEINVHENNILWLIAGEMTFIS